jgi:hypothetical protein
LAKSRVGFAEKADNGFLQRIERKGAPDLINSFQKPAVGFALCVLVGLSLACSLGTFQATPTLTVEPGSSTAATLTAQPAGGTAVVPQSPGQTPQTVEPTALVSETPPDFSSDPLVVVYVKDGDLWGWKQGQSRRLTTSGGVYKPRLSPDGKVAVYLRQIDDFHGEIWAINITETKTRRLVSVADMDTIGASVRQPTALAINPYHYDWVPGSHSLAFNSYQVLQGPGLILVDDLNLVDADTGQLRHLLLAGWGGEFVFSPDGSQVALSTSTDVILADRDGSNWRSVLTYEQVATYSEYRYYAHPVGSPNGKFLRVVIPPADPLDKSPEPTSLWMIPTNGKPAQMVGSLQAVPFFDTPPAFSPDLAHLIFLQETGEPAENRRELYIAEPDGSGAKVYQSGALLQFGGWALDGLHFTFSVGEQHAVQVGSLDAPALPLGSAPDGLLDVRWVDGERYLYLRQRAELFDLCLGTPGGEEYVLDTMPLPPPAYDFAR